MKKCSREIRTYTIFKFYIILYISIVYLIILYFIHIFISLIEKSNITLYTLFTNIKHLYYLILLPEPIINCSFSFIASHNIAKYEYDDGTAPQNRLTLRQIGHRL